MAQSRHYEGQKRTCPYCGQASEFSNRTEVPGSGMREALPGHPPPAPEYKPGWTCENKKCSQRRDFNL